MPCSKCKSDFNLLNWKLKCGECEDKYCNRCLKRFEGILYCEKCIILLKRPPDRRKLMELKPKDLQDYLRKHNISTHGLVEKQELVDLFCNKHIPVKSKRGTEKFTANFACSLPNFRDSTLNEFFENSIFGDVSGQGGNLGTNAPRQPPPRPPPPNHDSENQTENVHFNAAHDYDFSATQTESNENVRPTPEEPTQNSEGESGQHLTPEGSPLPQRYPKITDFKTAEELNVLSAKQLKTLLSLNRVDYKGCIEKSELLDKARRLWADVKKIKKEQLPENIEDLCKLCMDAPLDCVLLECGHIATCISCGVQLAECPICRQYVSRVVRTFKA